MIDDQTALFVHDLVEHTMRQRYVTRDEAKEMVLTVARAVCAPPPAPVKPVPQPPYLILIPFAGTA